MSRSCCQRTGGRESNKEKKKEMNRKEKREEVLISWRFWPTMLVSGNEQIGAVPSPETSSFGRSQEGRGWFRASWSRRKTVALVCGVPTHPRKLPPWWNCLPIFQCISAFALGTGQTKQCVDKVQGWGKTTKEGLFSCTHTKRKKIFMSVHTLTQTHTWIRFF